MYGPVTGQASLIENSIGQSGAQRTRDPITDALSKLELRSNCIIRGIKLFVSTLEPVLVI